jgi:hypothetical protein
MPDLTLTKLEDKHDMSVKAGGASIASKAFSISQDTVGVLMDLLIRQYTNPVEGSFREILSNAIDATIAADSVTPVEVTLPTELEPFLIITDYGVGMSEEDVDLVYCRYGSTSKRDDLNQIGSKGIGSKSPLAMSSSFTVTTTQKGNTIVASVEHTVQGGCFEVLYNGPTDLPDGTSIKIPYKLSDISTLRDYVYGTLWMFPVPFLVDGHNMNYEPTENTINMTYDGIDYHFIPSSVGNLFVNVGGLVYRVSDNLFSQKSIKGFNIIADVPIGSVTFPASRDSLEYSEHTYDTLHKVFSDDVFRAFKDEIVKRFNVNSLADALQLMFIDYPDYFSDKNLILKMLTPFEEDIKNNKFKAVALRNGSASNGYLPVQIPNNEYTRVFFYDGNYIESLIRLIQRSHSNAPTIVVPQSVPLLNAKKALYTKSSPMTILIVPDALYPLLKDFGDVVYSEELVEENDKAYHEKLKEYRSYLKKKPIKIDYIASDENLVDGATYYYTIKTKQQYISHTIFDRLFIAKHKTIMFPNVPSFRTAQKNLNIKLVDYDTGFAEWLNAYSNRKDILEAAAVLKGYYETLLGRYMLEHFYKLDVDGKNIGPLRKVYNEIGKAMSVVSGDIAEFNDNDYYYFFNELSVSCSIPPLTSIFSSRNVWWSLDEDDFDTIVLLVKKKGLYNE